jgi:hypothetical protein
MQHASSKTRTLKVYITTTIERDEENPAHEGQPLMIFGTGKVPLAVRVTEVHEESDVLMAEFYK